MTMKRRDALKTIGALAGAAGTANILPACGESDVHESLPGIDTFVFLMMENRSYDHYLGSRSLVEGKPGDGLVAGISNPNRNGDDVALWPATADTMCVLDPPHSWDPSRVQFNQGQNDGFIIAHQDKHGDGAIESMQYMLREHVPVLHALADEYTVCDRWFSSILGGTLPNRMYWHAGTSNGALGNFEVLSGAFRGITSLYHRLDEAGVDWRYYFNDIPVLGFMEDIELEGRLKRFSFFADDAQAGRLPPVVYIDPGFVLNDDHPPKHPLLGQQMIAATYQALATSSYWERCMLVIVYDEHGGFYDHVPPPTTEDEFASTGFDQLGFRVPALVIGPYTKRGYVSSVQYDHTSPLKHLSGEYGLQPLTTRVAAASDLLDCIDTERLENRQPSAPITLPAVEIDESALPESCSLFGERRPVDHDIVAFADAVGTLGKWDLRHEARDRVHEIAEYLDRHNLGRIRRGR